MAVGDSPEGFGGRAVRHTWVSELSGLGVSPPWVTSLLYHED